MCTRQHLDPQYEQEFMQHVKRDASEDSLHSLKLDEGPKIGYTLKCMGSGFWGLCAPPDFKGMINLLIKEGGDADTNGAVCGAMWGARYGYSALPRDWLEAMPHKAWLDRKVVRFLNLMGITQVQQPAIEKSYEERVRDGEPTLPLANKRSVRLWRIGLLVVTLSLPLFAFLLVR